MFSYSPEFGTWDFYCGSATPNGEIALVYNWAEESNSANTGRTKGFAEAAADALYAALRDPWLPERGEYPVRQVVVTRPGDVRISF